MSEPSVVSSLWIGLILRLGLMLFGLWQDSTMAVKFTDVDYFVFTDAAQFITKGDSPYERATYRYTPILAWILQPNIWWSSLFGKILFIICDILAGYLIYMILKSKSTKSHTAIFCAEAWLLNPLPIAVSSRGNAESIMAVLVLATLYSLSKPLTPTTIVTSAVLYGLSVHTKIYPVTYILPMYLYIVNGEESVKHDPWLKNIIGCNILPTWRSFIFIMTTGGIILALTGLCYQWCGMEFIQETYLYHITRRDTRHNFSPYFYMLYLTGDSSVSMMLGIAAFLPQMSLLLIISFSFYKDLPFCCFLQTFVFVTFNKVCTSQYFLWYLCLLPLIIPRLYITIKDAAYLLVLWFVGQAVWLLPAYYLEFEGQNTFIWIWVGGIIFFLINTWILHTVIQKYRFRSHKDQTEHRHLLTARTMLAKLLESKKKIS